MDAPRALAIGIATAAMTVCSALGQNPVPKREIGGGGSPPGITVVPREPKKITKTVTYMALTKKRQWTGRDGKYFFGTLLAFDAGDEAAFVPPTVIKDDKIRILKDGKEFVMPISRLRAEHADDVLEIEGKVKASYAAKKAASAAADASDGDE